MQTITNNPKPRLTFNRRTRKLERSRPEPPSRPTPRPVMPPMDPPIPPVAVAAPEPEPEPRHWTSPTPVSQPEPKPHDNRPAHLLTLSQFIQRRIRECRDKGEPYMPVHEAQQHERHVAGALRQGEIVPPEVLKAYPYFKQPNRS